MYMTVAEFDASIIGQDDDDDYEESGYVAGIHNGVAFIARYNHCSCYDTFTALCGGGLADYRKEGNITLTWSGTPDELRDMAAREADPCMPERPAQADDHDHDHLMEVYRQLRSHFSHFPGPQTPTMPKLTHSLSVEFDSEPPTPITDLKHGTPQTGDCWYYPDSGRWLIAAPGGFSNPPYYYFTPILPPKKVIGFRAGTRFNRHLSGWQYLVNGLYRTMFHEQLAVQELNKLPKHIIEFVTTEDGTSLT